jgi:N-acetylglucosaminyl-diphospho-decaprenol L-rhamnosyltransferase
MQTTISIVSHGHSRDIISLLNSLNSYRGIFRLKLILTLNAPELESAPDGYLKNVSVWPITIIRNKYRKGFAENHNFALMHADPGVWCVMNPDIQLQQPSFELMLEAIVKPRVGLVFPKQLSADGELLDYQRALVTPWALLKRYAARSTSITHRVDWVSGCFMAFPSSVYQQLNGFDEKYFLYCEDVDICLRLQLAGYKMVEADFSIIHDTRRGTLKKWDHFKWHVSSLLKLWCSRVFWVYLWNRHKIRQR